MSKESTINWKEYQEKIAEIFRSIGAEAITGYKIKGARGLHEIDVWVKTKNFGLSISWVCECKLWKNPIPKEKVLTLYEITKDIGADRGFLFSESGFQSGAIRATKNTNITLSSIDELREWIGEELQELTLLKFLKLVGSIRKEVKKGWIDDLKNPRFIENMDFDTCVLIDGKLMYMSLEIQKALNNDWPVYINGLSDQNVVCNDIEQLNMILEKVITEIQDAIVSIELKINENISNIKTLRNAFIGAIEDLIIAGEFQLFDEQESLEKKAKITLGKMKKIGKIAPELNKISAGTLKKEINKMMDLLIDTIYLYLSSNQVAVEEWNESIYKVKSQINLIRNVKEL